MKNKQRIRKRKKLELSLKGGKITKGQHSVNNTEKHVPASQQPKKKKSQKKAERDEAKTVKHIRKLQLLEANAEEDKTIKSLEKALKLKKRKRKGKQKGKDENPKIPEMFVDDGLDYILDVLDKKKVSNLDSSDSESMNENIVRSKSTKSNVLKRTETESSKPHKPRRLADILKERGEELTDEDEEQDEFMKEEDFSDDDDDDNSASQNESELSDSNEIEDDEMPQTPIKNKSHSEESKVWEDIYGRLRDQDGNVIKGDANVATYVPPAKRAEVKNTDANKKEELLKITRQLKGLLNRLSESNMRPISSQIEEMYMKYSRNDMNETLMSLISDMIMTPVLTPLRLAMEQAMLIALLHANIGPEVGAYFLQTLTVRFNQLLKSGENYGEGKLCNNLLVFLSHLYNFKVTHCTLIFDILKCLLDSFQDKDIELMQLLLKNVGFTLRKDDPLKLKEIVLLMQAKAPTFKSKENSARVQFMLDTMMAIRNNNMYKIPDYDPSIMEHAKKVLRGLFRAGSSSQELVITFGDLLKAEERGRWWIIGSAWSERDISEQSTSTSNSIPGLPKTDVSEQILELARQQHMNTEIRKTIFCIIMTAEDYMDGFEKLLRLNLKNQQEREIINVLLHCTLQEKKYNPYYAFLVGKFCQYARKFRMNLQFALWDKFKELQNLKTHQIHNMAYLLVHLFTSSDLPISVLKVIHFSEMNKSVVKFFRQILLGILLHDSEEVCIGVFKRISAAKDLHLLREGLRLFMHHFLLQNSNNFEPDTLEQLSKRVKLAENALNSAKYAFKL